MKKFLLSLAVIASTFITAKAEKVVFIAADATSAWATIPEEIANADETVIMNEGFFFVSPNQYVPAKPLVKSLSGKFLSISATPYRENTDGTVQVNSETDPTPKKNDSFVTSGGLRWYTNCPLLITPAEGVTIKSMKVRSQSTSYAEPFFLGEVKATQDKTDTSNVFETLEINKSSEFKLTIPNQNRVFYFIFETEGTPTQVEMPVASTIFPVVAADQKVSLSSNTAGADIYYTTDGTVPTSESAKYTEPISIERDVVIRAVAIKDGKSSFEFYGEYFACPAGLTCATFDFSNPTTLALDGTAFTLTALPIAKANKNIACGDKTITSGDVKMVNSAGKLFRSWTFGNVVEYRPDTNSTIKITVPEGNEIIEIYMVGCKIESLTGDDSNSTTKISEYNSYRQIWKANEGTSLNSVTLTDNIADIYIDQLYVYYKPVGSSLVATYEADEKAPVEFYNLQGVRVANPENGIFIRRQGSKTSKVVIK